jgi:hypothetical protein
MKVVGNNNKKQQQASSSTAALSRLRVLRSIRKEYHQRSTRASSASASNVNYSRGLTTTPSRRKDTIMTSTAKLASLRPTSRVSSSSGASLSNSSCISGRTSSSDDSQSKNKSGSSCSGGGGGGGGSESREMKPPNSASYSAGIIQERRMSNRQRKPSCRLHFDPSKLCSSGKSINVRSDGSSADRKRSQGWHSSLDKDSKTDHQGRVIKQHPNTNTKMPRLGQRLRSTAAPSTSSSSSNNLRLAVKKYLGESDNNGADDESTPNFDPKGNQKDALSSNPELLSAVGPMNECYCVRNESFFADGCLPSEKELVGKDFDIQPFCQVLLYKGSDRILHCIIAGNQKLICFLYF